MEEVNRRIISKIRESEFPDEIKEFLLKIVHFELENLAEGRWRYHIKYLPEIEKYSEKFEAIVDAD